MVRCAVLSQDRRKAVRVFLGAKKAPLSIGRKSYTQMWTSGNCSKFCWRKMGTTSQRKYCKQLRAPEKCYRKCMKHTSGTLSRPLPDLANCASDSRRQGRSLPLQHCKALVRYYSEHGTARHGTAEHPKGLALDAWVGGPLDQACKTDWGSQL